MPNNQAIATPRLPKVFVDLGYSTNEYDDHVISIAFKEQEIAAFAQGAATPDAILDVVARHFVRTASLVGVL